MSYVYKTIGGVKRRIQSLENSITTFKRMRGSNKGDFWKRLDDVDKAIKKKEKELSQYKHILSNLNFTPELIKQLKASEIF